MSPGCVGFELAPAPTRCGCAPNQQPTKKSHPRRKLRLGTFGSGSGSKPDPNQVQLKVWYVWNLDLVPGRNQIQTMFIRKKLSKKTCSSHPSRSTGPPPLIYDPHGRPSGLIRISLEKAVTFVDNHDTGLTQKYWPFPYDKVIDYVTMWRRTAAADDGRRLDSGDGERWLATGRRQCLGFCREGSSKNWDVNGEEFNFEGDDDLDHLNSELNEPCTLQDVEVDEDVAEVDNEDEEELEELKDPHGRPSGLIRISLEKAVTFVDNHDTGLTQKYWPFPYDKISNGKIAVRLE
ncbi:Alpha-amylase [Nymphaea thermarum]|nr:Alpha-amylase [Nymphaea thermarum]